MNAFIVASHLRWCFLLTTIVYLTRRTAYTVIHKPEVYQIMQEEYQKLHPDVNKITWPLIEKLTAEIHEKMCSDVLSQIMEPGEDINKYVYVPTETATVRRSRVFRNVPLYMIGPGVHYVSIIYCKYEDNMKVYLGYGDENHVYRLHRDNHNIFYLWSGLHSINVTI